MLPTSRAQTSLFWGAVSLVQCEWVAGPAGRVLSSPSSCLPARPPAIRVTLPQTRPEMGKLQPGVYMQTNNIFNLDRQNRLNYYYSE